MSNSQQGNHKKPRGKPFRKGEPTANPHGRPRTVLPSDELNDYQAKNLEKRVEALKDTASTIAYLAGNRLIHAFKMPGKKDTVALQREATTFGIMFDKTASGIEPSDLIIKIPKCLQDSFQAMIAVKGGLPEPRKDPALS